MRNVYGGLFFSLDQQFMRRYSTKTNCLSTFWDHGRPNEIHSCKYCKLVVEEDMVLPFSIDGQFSR